MMKFECKDMGMDCDFVATAETKEEVMALAMAHVADAHDDMLKDLTPEETEGMKAKIEALIGEDEAEEIVPEDAIGDDDEDEDDDDEGEDEEEGEEETSEVA